MDFYIADMHFGHMNCIKYDNRPFGNIEEMEQALIANWNNRVSEDDHIWIVGDFCYHSEKDPSYFLKQLKGYKHLIVGNHDKVILESRSACKHLDSIDKMRHLKDGKEDVILCHFPIAEWNGKHHGSYHVYGHLHASTNETYEFMRKPIGAALNAGCMINGYAPVTLQELRESNSLFQESQRLSATQKKQKRNAPRYLLLLEGYKCHDADEWMGIYFDDENLKRTYDQLVAELEEKRKLDRNYQSLNVAVWEFCTRQEHEEVPYCDLDFINTKQDIRPVKLEELRCFKKTK